MEETDTQGPEHELVRVVHPELAQELREVRKMVVYHVMWEMRELLHVSELLGVLVCTERCAETMAEIAARRLDRMETEG